MYPIRIRRLSSKKFQRILDDKLTVKSIQVFDFHSIYVFLNTESSYRHEMLQPLHNCPTELINYRYSGFGTRSRLLDLLTIFDLS